MKGMIGYGATHCSSFTLRSSIHLEAMGLENSRGKAFATVVSVYNKRPIATQDFIASPDRTGSCSHID